VILVEDWAETRRMQQAAGRPASQVARVPGIPPVAVRAALADDGPPQPERGSARSAADEFEPRAWPYRLPAGWRWVTELDGPAKPPDEAGGGPDDRDVGGEGAVPAVGRDGDRGGAHQDPAGRAEGGRRHRGGEPAWQNQRDDQRARVGIAGRSARGEGGEAMRSEPVHTQPVGLEPRVLDEPPSADDIIDECGLGSFPASDPPRRMIPNGVSGRRRLATG
jgi:hypothetical protein